MKVKTLLIHLKTFWLKLRFLSSRIQIKSNCPSKKRTFCIRKIERRKQRKFNSNIHSRLQFMILRWKHSGILRRDKQNCRGHFKRRSLTLFKNEDLKYSSSPSTTNYSAPTFKKSRQTKFTFPLQYKSTTLSITILLT